MEIVPEIVSIYRTIIDKVDVKLGKQDWKLHNGGGDQICCISIDVCDEEGGIFDLFEHLDGDGMETLIFKGSKFECRMWTDEVTAFNIYSDYVDAEEGEQIIPDEDGLYQRILEAVSEGLNLPIGE